MALLKSTAQRIDREPVLFLGCSASEILALVGAGTFAGFTLGFIAGFLTGLWFLIIPCMFLGSFIGVWKGGSRLMHAKEGKPDGYYGKFIFSWMAEHGLVKNYIKHNGYWRIRK